MAKSKTKQTQEYRKPADLKPHPLDAELYGAEDVLPDDFLESVKKLGILQRVAITPKNVVISGHRRWRAAEILKLDKIPVVVWHDLAPDQVEEMLIVSNNQREKTMAQRTNEYEKLKQIEGRRAAERQRLAPKGRSAAIPLSATPINENTGQDVTAAVVNEVNLNLGEHTADAVKEAGQASKIAASKVGVSAATAEKAAAVLRHAAKLDADGKPDEAAGLRAKLEKSVSGAFKDVPREPRRPRTLKDGRGTEIPENLRWLWQNNEEGASVAEIFDAMNQMKARLIEHSAALYRAYGPKQRGPWKLEPMSALMKQLHQLLEASWPKFVCKSCKPAGKGCPKCKGRGVVGR